MRCPLCGRYAVNKPTCPHCGAKMEQPPVSKKDKIAKIKGGDRRDR